MPIKKHVVKIEAGNKIELPKSLVDALGLSEGVVVRLYSCGDGYTVKLEVVPSYECAKMLEDYRMANDKLKTELAGLRKQIAELQSISNE